MSKDYGPNWQEQRKKALKDADYQCVSCGVEQGGEKSFYDDVSLHVHHKIPLRVFKTEFENVPWDIANHERNLVALCPSCHRVADDQSNHIVPEGLHLSGEIREEYYRKKPIHMNDNEFIEKLLKETSIEQSHQETADKPGAYREVQHDIREMIRSELEQFGRKYLQ